MAIDYNDQQMKELMSKIFPGYEDFMTGTVTPSITGTQDNPVVSFMIVCNDEASKYFSEFQDISAEVVAEVSDNKKGLGQDLFLRLEFAFPVFSLQFFTAVEGENAEQQKHFARVLMEIDYFVMWLVDKDKNLLTVMQVEWDSEKHKEILTNII